MDEIAKRPDAERHMLVPAARADAARSAFFAQNNAVSMLAIWLRRANVEPGAAKRIDDLLLEALGDPLGISQQQDANVWGAIAREHPDEYSGVMQRITRTDIEFFFKNVEGDDARDRAAFWIRYLRSIRRTKTFLDSSHRVQLKRRADAAAEPAQRMALARAGTFKSGSAAPTSAFVLWFDTVVCVEFSTSGNASYVYPRKLFDTLELASDRSVSASDLKNRDIGERMTHQGYWLGKFEQRLFENGIRPDRR